MLESEFSAFGLGFAYGMIATGAFLFYVWFKLEDKLEEENCQNSK